MLTTDWELNFEDPKPAGAVEIWLISNLRQAGITSAQGPSHRPSVLGGCSAAEVTCIEVFVFLCSAISISCSTLIISTSVGCDNSILYHYSTGSEGYLLTNCCHPQVSCHTQQNWEWKIRGLTLFLLRVWRKPSAPWTGSFPALHSASIAGMSSGMSCTCTPCTNRTRWGNPWCFPKCGSILACPFLLAALYLAQQIKMTLLAFIILANAI